MLLISKISQVRQVLTFSGTSDLAPLAEQAAMIKELFPDAKKVALLYCSAEANSLYQVKVVSEELDKLGIESKAVPIC